MTHRSHALPFLLNLLRHPMKTLVASSAVFALATALAATPADDLAAAAQKLAAAPNYSWTRTTEIPNTQFPTVPVEGRSEKGGYTVTTVTFNENTFQTVAKGGESVSQGQNGTWYTAEERRAQFAARGGGATGGGQPAAGRGRGGFNFGLFGGGAQASPAEEASSLVAKVTDLKAEDNALVGTLGAAEAAALLTFGGRGRAGGEPPPAPKNSSGTVRFWLKDGALVKYAVSVKGAFTLPGGDEREFARTTTTEFQAVGTTKVEVPEEAKKKLGH